MGGTRSPGSATTVGTHARPGAGPDRLLSLTAWLLCLAPLAWLGHLARAGRLTANPIEFLTHRTGYWALVLLCATLAVTPIRRLTGWNRLVRVRRTIGLFAFGYAALHFGIWLAVDRFFAWGDILADLVERPYITAGFAAFALLVPLALTSTRASVRRLGRRWTTIHRLIYLAAPLAVLHFFWKRSSKLDLAEPLWFAAAVGLLLAARLPAWLARLRRRPRPPGPALPRMPAGPAR